MIGLCDLVCYSINPFIIFKTFNKYYPKVYYPFPRYILFFVSTIFFQIQILVLFFVFQVYFPTQGDDEVTHLVMLGPIQK